MKLTFKTIFKHVYFSNILMISFEVLNLIFYIWLFNTTIKVIMKIYLDLNNTLLTHNLIHMVWCAPRVGHGGCTKVATLAYSPCLSFRQTNSIKTLVMEITTQCWNLHLKATFIDITILFESALEPCPKSNIPIPLHTLVHGQKNNEHWLQ